MTWQTPDGDRILVQEEAALVREGVTLIVDQIHDNIRFGEHERLWDFDVRLFDQLRATEQLETMKNVSHHLFTETANVAELSAINEAAVLAIYQAIATEIEIEIDTQHEGTAAGSAFVFFWRKRVASAFQDCFSTLAADVDTFSTTRPPLDHSGLSHTPTPEVRCSDVAVWREAVQTLGNRVLWEREFEPQESFTEIEASESGTYDALGIDYPSETIPEEATAYQPEPDGDAVRSLAHRKPR